MDDDAYRSCRIELLADLRICKIVRCVVIVLLIFEGQDYLRYVFADGGEYECVGKVLAIRLEDTAAFLKSSSAKAHRWRVWIRARHMVHVDCHCRFKSPLAFQQSLRCKERLLRIARSPIRLTVCE